ncbi:radical SAM protein [Elusimicrobiota bacterium]
MARLTFITFYNDFSVGVNVLSRTLSEADHDVATIFFKLPSQMPKSWFGEDPTCMETISPEGDIIGSNSDVNPATEKEVGILTDLIVELRTDILCLSTRSPDKDTMLQVMPKIRERFKGIIIAGGYGATFDVETYLEHVDYVFRGEGENRIVELMSKLARGESIRDFPNVAYRDGDRLTINKLGAPKELPLEKQTITDKSFYVENDRLYRYEERNELVRYPDAYSIFFGRGCISSCSYCSAGNWRNLYKSEGHSIGARRNRRIEDIIEELVGIRNEGYTFVNFRDEFLTAKLSDLKLFFELYEREVNLPFWAYLVPQQVLAHPELLEIAADAGFVDSVVGFQSGSDYINRTYFTRKFPTRVHLEYAHLLAKYNINAKYDFIVFNRAEKEEHIKETFELIQALPKKRSYVNCARLLYLPGTPASRLFAEFEDKPLDFGHYYGISLLYLICFIVPPDEFDRVLRDRKLSGSWEDLLAYYKNYLKENDIVFPTGTHADPESITTHRYARIIRKNKYSDIVLWGAGDYYRKMAGIFKGRNVRHHIDDSSAPAGNGISAPKVLAGETSPLPIFVCSPEKRRIKMKIIADFPKYPGKVYV